MFLSMKPTDTMSYTGNTAAYPSLSLPSTTASSDTVSVPALSADKENGQKRTGKAESKGECQTCKERKYVDGSDEGNVSFKAPGHIAPEASAGVVMSHEKEHVANAKREGSKPGNELLSATVSLKTAICPECGRSYVAGGTTRTLIKYGDSDYDKNKKAADLDALLGANVDVAI
ncbi:MAG: hypothetical protein IJ427_08945 [Lachnospiraceae bacterium]|nr:hypothetical protein [Lachnospiraceae bacterium]MBQ8548612.1 hypothetical protein [Lachnospiraceae bacterium]